MHWAAKSGNLAITRALVEAGANICAEDKWKLTPTFLARQEGDRCAQVFKYLFLNGGKFGMDTVASGELMPNIPSRRSSIASLDATFLTNIKLGSEVLTLRG